MRGMCVFIKNRTCLMWYGKDGSRTASFELDMALGSTLSELI
jgi:hypothetical protein